jgi:HAE1 family hydrophobic/amphiphilic exporter-1
MERAAAETLPDGMGYEWTGMSYQERLVGNAGLFVFGLALLLVYLILAAQYESWSVPLAVVLSVPLVVMGAMIAVDLRGLDNNVFTQIGLVLLVGLGAKNAILIVEFARENRAKGEGIVEAAVHAARTRFRPIILTSLAFILGVVPLLAATGAGAGSRRALGTAVFGGMIGVTVLGLLFTPMLYCIMQWIDETIFRRAPKVGHPAAAGHASTDAAKPDPNVSAG